VLSLIYFLSESGLDKTDAWGTGGVITMVGFGSGLFIGAGVDAGIKGRPGSLSGALNFRLGMPSP